MNWNYGFVIPDGVQLGAEHDARKDGKEESFETEKEEQDDRRRWAVWGALFPLGVNASDEL